MFDNEAWIMLRYRRPGPEVGDRRRGYELYGFCLKVDEPRDRPGQAAAMVTAGPVPLPPPIQ